MAYAAKTDVSTSRSKAEIEAIVQRYGAAQFFSGWSDDGRAAIGFTMEGRQVRFLLNLPDKTEKRFTTHARGLRTPEAALKEWEQACRQKWRALLLVIKAKLEACDAGISAFEAEFLANIILPGPNRTTVYDEIRPKIAIAYEQGTMPTMLPDYSQ